MSGGDSRASSTLNTRIEKKGTGRARRTKVLVKVNPSAIKLVMPGVIPTQSYAHQAMRAALRQVKAMGKRTQLGMQAAKLVPHLF